MNKSIQKNSADFPSKLAEKIFKVCSFRLILHKEGCMCHGEMIA